MMNPALFAAAGAALGKSQSCNCGRPAAQRWHSRDCAFLMWQDEAGRIAGLAAESIAKEAVERVLKLPAPGGGPPQQHRMRSEHYWVESPPTPLRVLEQRRLGRGWRSFALFLWWCSVDAHARYLGALSWNDPRSTSFAIHMVGDECPLEVIAK